MFHKFWDRHISLTIPKGLSYVVSYGQPFLVILLSDSLSVSLMIEGHSNWLELISVSRSFLWRWCCLFFRFIATLHDWFFLIVYYEWSHILCFLVNKWIHIWLVLLLSLQILFNKFLIWSLDQLFLPSVAILAFLHYPNFLLPIPCFDHLIFSIIWHPSFYVP